MSLTVEWVEWLDPRAVQQRAAMDVETTAMYAGCQAELDEAGRNAVSAALTIAPADISHTVLVLETGNLQVEAMALYESLGYEQVDVFGDYAAIPFGVCYEKTL